MQRPTTSDSEMWRAFWRAHNQPWRTEPEIGEARKAYLRQCRSTPADVRQGIYPFKDKLLSRADVEWLLDPRAGPGPVDWANEDDRKRMGLDLRGANLQGADLRRLPLARLRGGLTDSERGEVQTGSQFAIALICLEGANLSEAHLEGAHLGAAHLEAATLWRANLEESMLGAAHLEGANLAYAHLKGADFLETHLEGANLGGAYLEKARLINAYLYGARLYGANAVGAYLVQSHLAGADLRRVHLEGACLYGTHLEGKVLPAEDYYRILYACRDWWCRGSTQVLPPADLREAIFDAQSKLNEDAPDHRSPDITLGDTIHGFVKLADVVWGGVNLSQVDWTPVTRLGDEHEAWKSRTRHGLEKPPDYRMREFRAAVRANRQLGVALQATGMNEDAGHFIYRAQVLQSQVLRRQRKIGLYILCIFLDLLTGYGHKLERSLATYGLTIAIFACLYLLNGYFVAPHLTWDEALVLSVSSFHGRGFFSQNITLSDTYARLAAFEAFIGLVIEVTFIATLTQRLFAR